MDLSRHRFRDPSALIHEIAGHCPLTEAPSLRAVVEDPGTAQQLTHIERLPVDSRLAHHEETSYLLYDTMQRLPVPDFAGPQTRHRVLTLVVRPGLTVLGPYERQWLLAWRYSNHGRGAWDSDLALVTEHGWYEWLSGWAGHQPAMVAA